MSLELLPQRMQAAIRIDEEGPHYNGTPCWVWTAEINRNGYGTFRVIITPGHRKRKMAHIEAYVIIKGDYDRVLLLDHLCRNRPCCNPDHLEPVTVKVNTLRGEAVLFKPLPKATEASQ